MKQILETILSEYIGLQKLPKLTFLSCVSFQSFLFKLLGSVETMPVFLTVLSHPLGLCVEHWHCVSFYGCCNTVPQTVGLQHQRSLSHSSEGQKSEIKVSARPCSLPRLQGRICSRPLSQPLACGSITAVVTIFTCRIMASHYV